MNRIFTIMLVVLFLLFPELLLGYDDRDPWEGYGRGSGGSGSGEFFGSLFIIFVVLFWAVVIWGLITHFMEKGTTEDVLGIIGFLLFCYFGLSYLAS